MRTFRRHPLRISVALCAALLLSGCHPPVNRTPPPPGTPAELVRLSGAAVLIGTGDIASCSSSGDEATAMLVDSILRADSSADVPTAVFTTGDNTYSSGSEYEHTNCFTPSWGDPAKRIIKLLRPAPGNHEYNTAGAGPYYEYFGDRAGEAGKGYYSYDLGTWHVVVLNSQILVDSKFTAAQRKEMLDWLDKDLESSNDKCTVAYWHHPRFSSAWHGNDARVQPLWSVLFKRNVDLALVGHDHNYERFKPMDEFGVVDTTKGIVQIMVGTGGGTLRGFRGSVHPNSVARIEGRYGVLMLTLGGEEWRGAFIESDGRVWDPSGGKCH
jgi:hypothetical protein